MARIEAPAIRLPKVSVTRKMAAALPSLRALARSRGLVIHHLGAGYPHPELTEPRAFLAHKEAYYRHLADQDDGSLDFLHACYGYTDTLGPCEPRRCFATVYGRDWSIAMDPDRLLPTTGATGGINLICSMFERANEKLAYITDAPTYAGFLARATLNSGAAVYSVEMDAEGPVPDLLAGQIERARADGYGVYCYYTIPDGHNPAGFSFSRRRREEILEVIRRAGVLIVEDAPYLYINYAPAQDRPLPFVSLAPELTIHLFTGSKIGFPGPRIGYAYTEAVLIGEAGAEIPVTDLLLAESGAAILMLNPDALRGFEALLHDAQMRLRQSLWPVAEAKLAVYLENREIMLTILKERLGNYGEVFEWTRPGAGFFVVFRCLDGRIRTDDNFIHRLISKYGVVTVPMYGFYPEDARLRCADAGFDQLRLSFCYSEGQGPARVRELEAAVDAFCTAVLTEAGIESRDHLRG